MTATKSLWSEDLLSKDEDVTLPVTILQQQAAYLNEMTKNIVVASIYTKRIDIGERFDELETGLMHILRIVAPAIGNYYFDLLRITQAQLFPYPLQLFAPLSEKRYEVNTSEELENTLKLVFNDRKTMAAIRSLMLQSK
jgi:hypothetical protein